MNTRSFLLGLLAVAIAACGGAVDDEGKTNAPASSSTTSSGGSKGGGSTPNGDDPGNDLPQRGAPATCPGSRPSSGDSCSAEGLSCLYGHNQTGCDSDSASCQDGRWSVIGTPGCAVPHDAGSD